MNGREWYELAQVRGLGVKGLHEVYGGLPDSATLDDLARLDWIEFGRAFPRLRRTVFDAIHDAVGSEVEPSYETLRDGGTEIIHLGHPEYPARVLQRLGNSAPPMLYCRDKLHLLNGRSVAVVGSRQASPKTLDNARKIGAILAEGGWNVVSGYAKGVDTAAHMGAFDAEGTTTVVLTYGINHVRRKSEMTEADFHTSGLVVSQFHPNERWIARNAMTRNKLVCGLSEAVVVIEAGPERDSQGRMSGTFDTGASALRLGIPLLVLSPSLFAEPPLGNQALIVRGGVEIRSIADLIHQRDCLPRESADPQTVPTRQPSLL